VLALLAPCRPCAAEVKPAAGQDLNLTYHNFGQQLQKGDRQMENKPAQNIQDSFLNTARKDKALITLYLLSGVKLTGRIRSFDKYSVVLETNNQEQLIFKHAISTVVMNKQHDRGEARPVVAEVRPAAASTSTAAVPASSGAAVTPSGTEG
jgi:host factor-I protein